MNCKLIACGLFLVCLLMGDVVVAGNNEKGVGDEEKVDYNDFVWLKFDFDDTLAPSGGSEKDNVKVEFKRPNDIIQPGTKKVIKGNQPYFVSGFKGKGVFIGQHSENLLSADLAMMAYPVKSKLNFVNVYENATYGIVKSAQEALFGSQYLHVNADEDIRGGIALKIDIPGGRYKRGAYHIFVFSFYLKGKGIVQLITDVEKGIHDTPKSIKLTEDWQRISVWMASKKKTVGSVTFRNMTGMKCNFCLDGLQLERKKDIDAIINKHRMQLRSGTEFTPGVWMPGGKTYVTDLLRLSWSGEHRFPVEEGTINLWLKPHFFHSDAENHQLIHPKNGFYEYLFGYNSLQFVRDIRKADEVNNAIEVARPKFLKKGQWGMLTATWSNKRNMIKLYFNGRRIGFHESDPIELDRNPELDEDDKNKQLKFECQSMVIGSSGDRGYVDYGLMGVVDELTIYNRALTREQVQDIYPFNVEDDD